MKNSIRVLLVVAALVAPPAPAAHAQLGGDVPVKNQTGTSYAVVTSDRGKLVTFSSASPVAVTLPQAGSALPHGWYAHFQNRGAGTVTVTPTTSTIDGASSLKLAQHEGVKIVSDGTNYFTHRGKGVGGGDPASYAHSALPAPGSAGRLYRLTDKYRGLVMDTGTAHVSVSGETFNVKEFGAKGDGTTNDTAAIQAALDACEAHGGGVVLMPPGTYKVTASGGRALLLDGRDVVLRGAGQQTVIAMASATGDTLQIGTEGGTRATNAIVEYIQLTPSVTRTSGSEFFAPNYYNLTFREVRLDGFYRGFYLGSPTGCVDVKMFGVWADDFYQFAYFVRAISGYFYGIQADGMRSNTVVLHIDGYCEGLVFSGSLFINNYFGPKTGSYMLDIDNDVVARPSMFNYFYGCFFDFGNYAVVAQDAYSYTFTDCWFKGATDSGVLLEDSAHDFTFKGCDFFNSGGSGIYINGSDGHIITANRFYNNGVVIGPSPAIHIADKGAAHSEGILIQTNRIGHSPAPRISDGGLGKQNYGVSIAAGALSFIVTGNDCRGNSTGDIQNLAGTSALKIVQNNIF